MANEINLAASLTFAKGSSADGILAALTATWTGSKYLRHRQSIATTEEALVLGEATGGGGFFFAINRDATNFVSLRVATGATNFARLNPGEFAFFRWSTAATAPYAIADTAACELEYVVLVA